MWLLSVTEQSLMLCSVKPLFVLVTRECTLTLKVRATAVGLGPWINLLFVFCGKGVFYFCSESPVTWTERV